MSRGAGGARKSSSRRLLLVTITMVGFAALTWGPSLFSRNVKAMFIPAFLSFTIVMLVICFWFTKKLMTYEKYRDSETAPQGAPAHSH
jgi:choline-glycine betaine transporter